MPGTVIVESHGLVHQRAIGAVEGAGDARVDGSGLKASPRGSGEPTTAAIIPSKPNTAARP